MISAIVGLGLIAAFIGYDVYLALDGVRGNTWSELARKFALASPVLPWACGVLCGHFFHPAVTIGIHVPVLIWLTFAVAVTGAALRRAGRPVPPWAPLVPGFCAGWLTWPV